MTLRINWKPITTFIAGSAALLAACGSSDAEPDDVRIHVVTSTGLLADIVSNVAGDAASVDSVIPANADAHTFSLTPGDARQIADADIVFVIGADFSAAEDEMRGLADGTVVTLTDGLQPTDFEADPLDPHFWLDPTLVAAVTEVIQITLANTDPSHAADYGLRAEAYRDDLGALDKELAELFGTGEPGKRPLLVTFHDAFGYLARRYDLTVLGFVVEGPEEEPSAADIAALIDQMKHEGAKVIFKEPQFDARVVEQVAADADADVRDLPSATLTDDCPTYVDLMRTIAAVILE